MSTFTNNFTPYQPNMVQQFGLPSYGYQPSSGMVRLGWNNSPSSSVYTQPTNSGLDWLIGGNSSGTTIQTPAPVVEAQPAVVNPAPSLQNNNTPYNLQNAGARTSDGSLFGWGKNEHGQTVFGGATGAQWAGLGLQTAFSAFNAYQSYKAQKLAREQWEDQKRLNHANYQNQAKAYNNSMRNQMSGRGYIGMTSQAKETLGREYNTRKAKEDY